jgi:hypothetical protein
VAYVFESIEESEALPVVWFADVAAFVGRAMVPEILLIFHVPDWAELTVKGVLSEAIVTR